MSGAGAGGLFLGSQEPGRVDLDAYFARIGYAEPQPTRHEPIRILEVDGELRLERLLNGIWTALHDLVVEAQTMVDIAAANWIISTHPDSTFRNRLVASRTQDEVRHVLIDRKLVVRHGDGRVERRDLTNDQVEEILRIDFGLDVPVELCSVLERLATPAEGAPAAEFPVFA